jgi:hypothetical protein
MYLGLFLAPWMTMYALSTIVFNHWESLSRLYGGQMERFVRGREQAYYRTFARGTSPSAMAEQILEDLHLSGDFRLENSAQGQLVIWRLDPFQPRRITWKAAEGTIVVEKQVFRAATFLTALHARVGYGNQDRVANLWAVGVDLSILATLLWIFSGFWMWWELRVTRRWGLFCALLGVVLFALFLTYS